jgi:5'/3'-nucleotidase
MHVLLTNDDGVHADGIWALYEKFKCQNHTVTVVAPDRERSAVGHGITLHQPLRASQISVNGGYPAHAVNGTPADCIKLALLEILKQQPDIVVSGINPGANVGIDINYSGTAAAAKEAALAGLPALAVSIAALHPRFYGDTAEFIEQLACFVFAKGLPRGTFLNVNLPDMPPTQSSGIHVSRQAANNWRIGFDKRQDPRQRSYFWQGRYPEWDSDNPDLDGSAVHLKHISITPIQSDMTDYAMLEGLKDWDIPLANN